MKKAIVVVFAKYPEQGKVKTRLAKDIGKKKATDLYAAILKDISHNIISSDYDVAICYAPKNKEKEIQKLTKIKQTHAQSSGDLGERMFDCFSHYLKEYRSVIIIGSDIPMINKTVLNKALKKLQSKDIVVGKADDGGYYLIGMKETHDIFQSIEWSTSSVLMQTIQNIQTKSLSYALLPSILEVDTLKDLQQLKNKITKESKHTFEMLQKS